MRRVIVSFAEERLKTSSKTGLCVATVRSSTRDVSRPDATEISIVIMMIGVTSDTRVHALSVGGASL